MAEHEVMWIGRRPATMASPDNPATTEDFAAAMTAACSACGVDVEDYVAAAGVYGSWMVRFRRDGARQRLVWNGKAGRLVLEAATAGPDWVELGAEELAERDQDTFVAGIGRLLGGHTPAETGG